MATADINSVAQQDIRNVFANESLGYAGLAEGTNAATIKTTAAVAYRIGGQTYTKAATDNIAVTAATAQAANTTCYYAISVNAAGTVTTTKGVDDSATVPETPDANALLGYLKIVTTVAFTPGTTDLGAAGVTDTWAHANIPPASLDATLLTFA